MDFTNEVLKDMKIKKDIYNEQYSRWYYGYSKELESELLAYSKRIKKRGDRIQDCLNLWVWDAYHKNKLLDLQKVNRCMNNKFCPNCRRWDLASCIHNFKAPFTELLKQNYYPYMLTLTIPNVLGEELKDTIDKMNKSFRKFFDLLSQDTCSGRKGFSERLIKFDGALKVLEITVRTSDDGRVIDFHPHFHCIIFSTEYDEYLFEKKIPGAYSKKRKKQDYNSLLDIHLMKLWKMCFDGIRMSVKNYENMSENWFDLYLCDIRELDEGGIYEVLKYTFKDSDVKNYYIFKTLVYSLDNKRIRQGYGVLYNLKCENETDGEKQDLEQYLIKKENPEQLLTREIKTLITEYHDYKKISRFKNYEELNNLD